MSHSDAGTLLVGISNPETADALVRLAAALSRTSESDVILTHVVSVANQIALGTGSSSPEVVQARDLLQDASAAARDAGAEVRAVVEVARSVEEGLLAAADSHDAAMILVGYSGVDAAEDAEDRFDRTMHRVARKSRADVVVAKFRQVTFHRMLVPVAADAPLRLTALLCRALTAGTETAITFLHVVGPEDAPEEARRGIRARLDASGLADRGDLEVVSSDDPTEVIVSRAEAHDLVLLGPSGRPGLLDAVFSNRARRIADAVSATVVLGWSLTEED
ncbi:MAG: universal stress protein [Longimicrobiales bacterium]|nr:universal stress protein [Longimicrobiales bacterium]